jgi:hypothetical protein
MDRYKILVLDGLVGCTSLVMTALVRLSMVFGLEPKHRRTPHAPLLPGIESYISEADARGSLLVPTP